MEDNIPVFSALRHAFMTHLIVLNKRTGCQGDNRSAASEANPQNALRTEFIDHPQRIRIQFETAYEIQFYRSCDNSGQRSAWEKNSNVNFYTRQYRKIAAIMY